MTKLMVVLIFIWTATVVPMQADGPVSHTGEGIDASTSTSVVVVTDDQNRKHRYIRSPVTGKAERVYPNLNALDFSGGKEITASNIEQVSRKVLAAIEQFSNVNEDKLTLLRAKKSKLGMWIVSFEQIHRGFLVYGARYGVTIGRNNTVLSVGGEVYDITSVQTQGTVNEEADSADQGDLGGLLDQGPIGGVATVDNSDLEVSPTVTSSQVVQDLLAGSDDAVMIGEPTLVIYPDVGETGVTYVMGWAAAVDDNLDSRRVVVNAFSGDVLETESLVAHANYSRKGKVDGKIYPRHDYNPRVKKNFRDQKVKAINPAGQTVASDNTSASGNYSIKWNGGTASYKVGSELEGPYVKSVSDGDNPDLDHWITVKFVYTGTYNWTWSDESRYADQINIFYHTNLMARWWENLVNVNHKVKLQANKDIGSTSHATASGGSVPTIKFSDRVDSEHQSDTIYHEYSHTVGYKMHGSYIGNSGQADALDEALAFYFAQTFIGDHKCHFADTAARYELDNTKKYPRDYNNTSSEHKRAMIPAGAAWDLRQDIGASDTDEIIVAAFEMDSPRADTFEEFFDNVLLADDDINGNGYWSFESCDHGWGDTSPHAGEIWDAFAVNHTIPSSLLDEDPDCSPKALADAAPSIPSLEGAYPNPFNSSVSLRYRVDEPGKVDIGVYSITGQLVRHLSSDRVAVPGSYSIAWDGLLDNGFVASSGMYFIRVRQPDKVKSFKLTLLK